MQALKPDSVLFSLKELRRIEQDRVSEEEQARLAQDEAELQARIAEDRLREEQAQREILQEQERLKREQEQQELRQREQQLRLENAERQARVQAEMELEKHRQAAEIKARALGKRVPWVPIGLAIGVLLLGVAGLSYYYVAQKEATQRAQARSAKIEQERARLEAQWREKERIFEQQQQLQKTRISQLMSNLESAKNVADKDRLRRQIAAQKGNQRKLEARRARANRARKAQEKTLKLNIVDDPLGGIPR